MQIGLACLGLTRIWYVQHFQRGLKNLVRPS